MTADRSPMKHRPAKREPVRSAPTRCLPSFVTTPPASDQASAQPVSNEAPTRSRPVRRERPAVLFVSSPGRGRPPMQSSGKFMMFSKRKLFA
jgi:hypothetical protein